MDIFEISKWDKLFGVTTVAGSLSAILWAAPTHSAAVAAGCVSPSSLPMSGLQDAAFVEVVIMVAVRRIAALDFIIVLPNGSSPTPSGNRLATSGPT